MTASIIPDKLKEVLEDVGKVYNSKSGMNVYPNSFSKLQTEILKVCNKNVLLEKENAELKETLRTYNGCGDWDDDFHACRVYLQHEELQMYIHKLTEAKELLKDLIRFQPYIDKESIFLSIGNEWKIAICKAEQFLNSEVSG